MMLLMLPLMLVSCSPFALVNSETYNNAVLSDYKTFRIVTPADGQMPPGMESVTYYNIAAASCPAVLQLSALEKETTKPSA